MTTATTARYRVWNWSAFTAHCVLVVLVARYLSRHYVGPGYQEITQIWVLFLVVDFPSSIISESLCALIDVLQAACSWQMSDRAYYIVLPMILYGTIGGIQYFFLGGFAAKLIRVGKGGRKGGGRKGVGSERHQLKRG